MLSFGKVSIIIYIVILFSFFLNYFKYISLKGHKISFFSSVSYLIATSCRNLSSPSFFNFFFLSRSFFLFYFLFVALIPMPLFEPFIFGSSIYHIEPYYSHYGILISFVFLFTPNVFLLFNQSSQNKMKNYFLLERHYIQFFSFILPLSASLFASILVYSSADYHEIVNDQAKKIFYFIPHLGLFKTPLSFALFTISYLGICAEGPFEYKNNSFSRLSTETLFDKTLNFSFKIQFIILSIVLVFLFLGGHGLLPGLGHMVELIPNSLYFFQAISFFIKIIIVLSIGLKLTYNIPKINNNTIMKWGVASLSTISILNLLYVIFSDVIKDVLM